MDREKNRAYNSNYGTSVDIAAPGVSIESSIPNEKYGDKSGTSMAAPHVTAAAAMLLLDEPQLKPSEVATLLKDTAEDLGTQGWDAYYGTGFLNLQPFIEQAHTITFDANGGIVSQERKLVIQGKTYGDLPVPMREGYTFSGWYTAVNGGTEITSDSTVNITTNQTLFAHWTANDYIITFDANGGSEDLASQLVTVGEAYGDLPVPTREGYTFDGWHTAVNGGMEITSDSIVNIIADETLFAHWTGNDYTITFDANGGSVNLKRKSVTIGKTYGDLPVPVRNGYTFAGWHTSASEGTKITHESEVNLTTDQTLFAHWTGNSYTITFDANGSSENLESQLVIMGEAYGDLPVPVRNGYSSAARNFSAQMDSP